MNEPETQLLTDLNQAWQRYSRARWQADAEDAMKRRAELNTPWPKQEKKDNGN